MNKMENVMSYFAIGEECDFCGQTPKVTIELRGVDEGQPFCWHVCIACLTNFLSTIYWYERAKEQRDEEVNVDAQEEADAGPEGGEASAGSE